MTESQAWAYLARKWSHPKRDEDGVPFGGVCGRRDDGICISISGLKWAGRISLDTMYLMESRIPRRRTNVKYDTAYAWARTPRGAKSRAAFCRKMAVQTRKRA